MTPTAASDPMRLIAGVFTVPLILFGPLDSVQTGSTPLGFTSPSSIAICDELIGDSPVGAREPYILERHLPDVDDVGVE